MIIGIDPGITGAIAFMGGDGTIKLVVDMPVMAKTHGTGTEVDPYALSRIILENKEKSSTIYLEQVDGRPRKGPKGPVSMGATSAFNFGESFGAVKGVIGSLQMRLKLITPQSWKKKAKITGKNKDAARTLAIQLHPEVADWLTRKKDVGRADAICIAHFG